MSPELVASLRANTPGCSGSAHFNHAGASLPSQSTIRTVIRHLERESLHGPMEVAEAAAPELANVRSLAARAISAEPTEIALMASGGTAWCAAFSALPALRPGDRLLVGRHEWGGNLGPMLQAAERSGAKVEQIPCTSSGEVDPEELKLMLDERVRLVSLTWLPANGGLINDAAAIGAVTSRAGIPYFLDAGQALGQLEIDVRKLNCDVLTAAGKKHLRGPRGTSLLYVRSSFKSHLLPLRSNPTLTNWQQDSAGPCDDAIVFEPAEKPLALFLGLGDALHQYLSLGPVEVEQRILGLAEELRDRLEADPALDLLDLGRTKSGLVSFGVAGVAAAEVQARLAEAGFNLSSNGIAYTPFDMRARGLREVVRASLSYINTEEEVERLATAIIAIARGAQ